MASYETPQFGDSPEDSETLLPPEAEMPHLDLIVDGQNYQLTWKNTLIRKFLVGGGKFDYFLLDLQDDPPFYLFFERAEAGEGIKDFLERYTYPVQVDPILDDLTINLYSRVNTNHLDDELHDTFPIQ
ncbi:hypothetical protein KW801_03790 [Candidatus Saccharibacteria bacterium]|nr:hypothetical protein [Candidatus Saccharibacteria bacterium]